MNQSFNLFIAAETIANDAQQLGVTVDELQRICVKVDAKIIRQPVLRLQLTYQITLPNQVLAHQLAWPTWQQARVEFADYLWEETCLECFIACSPVNDEHVTNTYETAPYIEINASPDGRYALYEFKSYRNPATLPPVPLYKADGRTRAYIEWTGNAKLALMSVGSPLSPIPSVAQTSYRYERSFGLPLTQLPNQQYVIADTIIEQIHPCVILWFGETALYFASNHACPPDFHNRNYWPNFEL